MTEILDGTILAKAIREKAKKGVAKMKNPPGLAVLLVGNNPASELYVGLKEQAAKDVGIYVEIHRYESTRTVDLVAAIHVLNSRPDIHGILVQLPLPEGLATDAIIEAIHPTKDVDGFHPENRAALHDDAAMLVPPVTLAIMRLLQATRQPLRNKTGVIIGNSAVFAEPLIDLLQEAGVTATFVPKATEGLPAIARAADVVVVAVGAAGFLTRDMVKEAAMIIDVGTNRTSEGKVVGDAAPELLDYAGFLSKVPGGVGPLTVAYLLMNTMKAKGLQERNLAE